MNAGAAHGRAMPVVILAGGLGTRLSEETVVRPKPMVEIGDRPILLHIMEIYAQHGFKEFVVALGYKGDLIKRFFHDFLVTQGDMTVDLATGETVHHGNGVQRDWRILLIDTGFHSMTGGRVRRLAPILKKSGPFMLTYGDGVANVDLDALLTFHRQHGRLMTLTAVRPPARFGTMSFDGDRVIEFEEKPQTSEGWINGGFFVCEPAVLDYLEDDHTILEQGPLEQLAADGELMAFRHHGFWKCMDTLRDKTLLNDMWKNGSAPWRAG